MASFLKRRRGADAAPVLKSVYPTDSARTKSASSGNHSDSQSPGAAVGHFIYGIGRQCAAEQYRSFQPGKVVRYGRPGVAGYDERPSADWPDGVARSRRTLYAADRDPAALLRSCREYSLLSIQLHRSGFSHFDDSPRGRHPSTHSMLSLIRWGNLHGPDLQETCEEIRNFVWMPKVRRGWCRSAS